LNKIELDRFLDLNTDHYFKKAKNIIIDNGDVEVVYAIFMRRPVLFCPKMAIKWLKDIEKIRETKFDITMCYEEGSWVGAGQPLMYIKGLFSQLVELETIYLQLIGPASVAAYNAYLMCIELPNTKFMAMDARHCAGPNMHELMAYGASVGSKRAKKEVQAKGFIGSSCNSSAHFFESSKALGTMPHALIGYAGSTLKAAQIYNKSFPKEKLSVLVDYFGNEVTDTLKVCDYFKYLVDSEKLFIRLDTHGGRYIEGLDIEKSYEILEMYNPNSIRTYRNEQELKWLVGAGVSAAAIIHIRNILDSNGYEKVKIIASSGFNPAKCKLFSAAKVPVDIVGTGSYIPDRWEETYATSDIIKYNGKNLVKKGREFLINRQS
jgi:nicotinate phosphoribosyltransferase